MKRTLVALVEDKPGVLNRIVSLFRRRNFNIESLTVGHSEQPGVSRLTIVVEADNVPAEQFVYQLDKLINVIDVTDLTETQSVVRELALIKVKADSGTRAEIMQLVDVYRAKIVDVSLQSLVIEVVGPEDRVQSLIGLLESFGVLEIVRTGRVAMLRGAEVSNATNGLNGICIQDMPTRADDCVPTVKTVAA
jgi:acetolactate synthase I/III small subunit